MRTLRRVIAIIGVSVTALFFAGVAGTGTFDSVQSCDDRAYGRPFMRWLDPMLYTEAPGGDFESGTSGWTLSGGARLVSGNESFNVGGAGSRSLYLPPGSSATSPAMCIEVLHPTVRYFAKNRGSVILSDLLVQVVFKDPLSGKIRALPAGVHTGGSRWHPSLPSLVLLDLLAPVLGDRGQLEVAFRFRPVGLGAQWQIDDLYVDPLRNR
jgi:hypothetical protein